MADLADDFLAQVEKLARARVQALAHPFRVFLRKGREVPEHLYRPVAEILAGHGVAAEINFHTNQPDPEFYALCLELGVKLSVGSDAHAMGEVGALAPHLALLQTLGVTDRLDAVLWRPCAKR
jgi:histidinol phosphatase-like PHP family hydrolase